MWDQRGEAMQKTQKFILEVTGPTGQFPVSESDIEDAMGEVLPDSYRINVVEQNDT
jgi:hypothetical protein